MGNWRDGGVDVGDVVRLDDGEFEGRIGHCWARGRLKHGDLLVAVRHSGDSFFDYLLLEHSKGTTDGEAKLFLKAVPAEIGAYTVGRTIATLDAKQLAGINEGGTLTIDLPNSYDTPARKRDDEIPFNTYRDLVKELSILPDAVLDQKFVMPDDTGRMTQGGRFCVEQRDGVTSIGIVND